MSEPEAMNMSKLPHKKTERTHEEETAPPAPTRASTVEPPSATIAEDALESCHGCAQDNLRIDLPKIRSNLASVVQTLDQLPLKTRVEERMAAFDAVGRELLEAFVTLGSIEQLVYAIIELDSGALT